MLKISFKIDGKKRTFQQSSVSARVIRKCMGFYAKMEKIEKSGEEPDMVQEMQIVDEMIEIVCSAFPQPEVNYDNLLDGLTVEELNPTLEDVFSQISAMGQKEKKA